jgi:YVTN family beta-propeller protein
MAVVEEARSVRMTRTAWRLARRAILAGLALLTPTLAACGAPAAAQPPTTPTPLALPAPLAGYHVFVSDLLTGDVAELGMRTYHAARSVHGLGLATDGRTLYATDVAGNALLAYPVAHSALGRPRRVSVGLVPVHMVQTLDGRAIFVTNFGAASVSVVDTAAWRVTATIPVPVGPHGITISPDGRWIYVACVSGGAIAIIDATSARLVGTIALPAVARPYGVALSRDGRYLYAPDSFAAHLFVVDTATRQVIDEVPIGLRAQLATRSADGATLYVTNGQSGTVSVLDLRANPAHPRVRATVQAGAFPHGLALTPDGRYLVVANNLSDNISVIDTATDQVLATIPGERYPNDVIAVP